MLQILSVWNPLLKLEVPLDSLSTDQLKAASPDTKYCFEEPYQCRDAT